MTTEIERKWRAHHPPPLPPGVAFRQGYLTTGAEGEVRLRDDGRTRLTVKRGAGLIREEVTVPLDPAAFEDLWALTAGRQVVKTRHLVAHGAVTLEVDVYAGSLEGLVVAEVEFPDVPSAEAFTPPPWFDEELTGDPAWSNAHLAMHGHR